MDKVIVPLPPDTKAEEAARRAVMEAAKSRLVGIVPNAAQLLELSKSRAHLMVPKEEVEPMDETPHGEPTAKAGEQESNTGPKNRKDFRKEAAQKRRKKIKRKNRKGRK